MRTRALLVVGAALSLAVASATSAEAGPSPICPGVVQTAAHAYKLTSNTACDLGLFGDESNVNLAGWTLTTGTAASPGTVATASDLTLRNGNLRAWSIFWAGDNGSLQGVDASFADPSYAGDRFIQVGGTGFSVAKSRLHDVHNALDLYLAGQATISDSTFVGDATAVSVQSQDQFTVTGSTFVGNSTGLLLWNEDGIGVDDVVVSGNVFKENTGAGIQIRANKTVPSFPRTLDHVTISGNRILQNGGPGIDVTVYCASEPDCSRGVSSIAVASNTFRHNGYAPPAGLGNDGVSARTTVGSTASTTGAGLGVVTLTGNDVRQNADRGIDAVGVTDGGGNTAHGNVNPAQCLGVVCS